MIKFKDVNKYYVNKAGQKQQALVDVSLEINQGNIYGVIGRSGAGKSTLVRLVNKLEAIDSGEVWVDNLLINNTGHSLNTLDLKKARQNIAMIFQHFNLLESYTVLDNILFPLKIRLYGFLIIFLR